MPTPNRHQAWRVSTNAPRMHRVQVADAAVHRCPHAYRLRSRYKIGRFVYNCPFSPPDALSLRPLTVMTTVRPFRAHDLFVFNNVNMDHWTETYSNGFYLSYLAQWPDMTLTACAAHTDAVMGYVLGKAEGREPDPKKRSREPPTLHGHVTAVSVGQKYRRLGVAQMLMDFFEYCSQHVYQGFFVDLFVRPSNATAIHMYEKRGYSVYRRVSKYYQGMPPNAPEDGYGTFFFFLADPDMRLPLPRDVKKQTIRSNGRDVVVQPQYVNRTYSHISATVFEPFVHKGI